MTDEVVRASPALARIGLVTAVLGLALLCACASPTRTQTSGSAALDLAADERVVVYPPFPCLSDALAEEITPASRLMSTDAFQDAMFPWFEPPHAPKDADSFRHLLDKPHVRVRIEDLGVRYLISLTERSESGGFPGFLCGAGYGGAGCLGVGWENNKTSLNAVIWDLRSAREAGAFSTETSGTSLAIGIVVPIIFIASTEADACRKTADVIADGLAGLPRP